MADDPMGTGTGESQPLTAEELIAAQAAVRQEIAALRAELAQAREAAARAVPNIAGPSQRLSDEELMALRMQQISEHDYYCPGCGKLVDYRQQCHGRAEAPHPPMEVVSTDELKSGDTSRHTPAEAALVKD